jgi:cell division protein FtsI (penicillin-binding protein 3)
VTGVALVQRRIGLLFGAFFLLLVLAMLRTMDLGFLRSGSLSAAANQQHLTQEVVPALRGAITDRNGIYLAVSEPADDVSATPYLIKDPVTVAAQLAPLLGRSQDAVLAKITERSGFVYLARALPQARAQAIMRLNIPGMALAPTARRVYPRGDLAAQVLGLVGTEGQGLAGLEYSLNPALHGRAGDRTIVSDAIGQPISIKQRRAELAGANVSLTVDSAIQQRTEDVLAAIGQVYQPLDATAIVMDPNTGGIYALANWPPVNANHPGAAPASALEDRAVGFNYEPGSTFKVVTVAGALSQGLVTPDSSFDLPPQIQVADRTIHDAESRGYETLSVAQILAQSSNVGAITIGLKLGPDNFNTWVRRFGFGAPTGVDLPGEQQGIVLKPSQYSGSSMGNLPIGQGESVTPMQIATAYAAIANGGILRAPHIVGSVGGKAVALPPGHRIISPVVAAEIRQMLEGVLAPGGTASEVKVPGYTLAGKTGTANKVDPATGQYSNTAYVASFVGFAPAQHPRLETVVIVDEPQTSIYGGTVAAPAFGQIMGFALPYLRIPPG